MQFAHAVPVVAALLAFAATLPEHARVQVVRQFHEYQRKRGIELRDNMAGREMPDVLPTTLWVAFADSDGHVGTPIKVSPTFTAADRKHFAEWQKHMESDE